MQKTRVERRTTLRVPAEESRWTQFAHLFSRKVAEVWISSIPRPIEYFFIYPDRIKRLIKAGISLLAGKLILKASTWGCTNRMSESMHFYEFRVPSIARIMDFNFLDFHSIQNGFGSLFGWSAPEKQYASSMIGLFRRLWTKQTVLLEDLLQATGVSQAHSLLAESCSAWSVSG